MPRLGKWVDALAWGSALVVTVTAVTDPSYSAWSRVWRLAVGVFLIGSLSWKLHEKRCKRLARRQALLTRLDRLLRDEVKRR
ncbi:hypothetical protein OG785_17905 [Streptomyces sp. NBC_00006]|uniref:hypothetical protein n=1 Tax=unclassified Streptomyces TaxID=2593676 RepID=UPI002251AF74|nr:MULTISPECIES: hypothetical protein [unclassified Streptomyces]MCX5532428.1 hypothetical protein [Streptomyces sp. NBC_00006]